MPRATVDEPKSTSARFTPARRSDSAARSTAMPLPIPPGSISVPRRERHRGSLDGDPGEADLFPSGADLVVGRHPVLPVLEAPEANERRDRDVVGASVRSWYVFDSFRNSRSSGPALIEPSRLSRESSLFSS